MLLLILCSVIIVLELSTCCCQAFSSPTLHHDLLSRRWQQHRQAGHHDNDTMHIKNKMMGSSGLCSSAVRLSSTTITKMMKRTATTSLSMGLFDFIQEKFLDSRDGDFIPLEQSDEETFGPGPLIVMYAVPESMDDEELMDMIDDGMPLRQRSKEGSTGVIIQRISGGDDDDDGLLDLTVGEALDKAMQSSSSSSTAESKPKPIVVNSPTIENNNTPCPVLYFSGVTNTEMMDTYRIIANEIYEETAGVHWPACAKVVKPALDKSMRQVLMEISGDHADAMRMQREEAEKKESE